MKYKNKTEANHYSFFKEKRPFHVLNQSFHLLPRVQWSWINTHTVQLPISDSIEHGDGGADSMDGGASHVVINTNLLLHSTRVVDHRVLKHRHQRRPHRPRRSETWILDGSTQQKVQVRHVGEVLI